MKRLKNTKPKAKPNGWEEFLRKFIVIFGDDFGIYKDKKGKWRFSLEGYNFDFERQIKKLEELYSQAILSAEKEGFRRGWEARSHEMSREEINEYLDTITDKVAKEMTSLPDQEQLTSKEK